jgi:hypothetical protein
MTVNGVWPHGATLRVPALHNDDAVQQVIDFETKRRSTGKSLQVSSRGGFMTDLYRI